MSDYLGVSYLPVGVSIAGVHPGPADLRDPGLEGTGIDVACFPHEIGCDTVVNTSVITHH